MAPRLTFTYRRMSRWLLAIALTGAACARPPVSRPPAPVTLPFSVDTQRAEWIAPGVARRFVYAGTGPWAINVLDVDRAACYSAVAVKGFPVAAGRKKTSAMLAELDSTGTVIGGVNADFFMPNGTPTNAHVSRGDVLTGPVPRPVIAFDSAGTPRILTLMSQVTLSTDGGRRALRGWNRGMADGAAWFDARWGASTDTASNVVEIVLARAAGGLEPVAVDTTPAGTGIPAGGGVLVFRGRARADGLALAARLDSLGPVSLTPRLLPLGPVPEFRVMEAVGGRPLLVRDSVMIPGLDSAGGAGFAASRHPRTAVGIADGGRRLLLVTVDGRQKPYSDGMTLRELATLMLALGARDALNLDGGGSTAMVYKPAGVRTLAVANRPSDAGGERAVGNALAIVRGCSPGIARR